MGKYTVISTVLYAIAEELAKKKQWTVCQN